LLAELDRASHIVAVAPALFGVRAEAEEEEGFLAAETLKFVRRMVSWMAGADGRRLEIALAQPPAFGPDVSGSLALWHELQPRLADGSLKFMKLPRGFDVSSWPRAMTNPGREGGVAWFTIAGAAAPFLDRPLPAPLWKANGLTPRNLEAFRAGWEEIKVSPPAKPSELKLREYGEGEPRDLEHDFEFCRERSFSVLRIEDPYVVKNEAQNGDLGRLLLGLARLWRKWPAKVELKVRDQDVNDYRVVLDGVKEALKARGSELSIRPVLKYGPGRQDFHDRRLVFHPDDNASPRRVTVILTGGVDRYVNERFECGIIIHRDSAVARRAPQ
jgi:hypothetical protein